MSKPIPTPTSFSLVPPQWQIQLLDNLHQNIGSAINDMATYSTLLINSSSDPNNLTFSAPTGLNLSYTEGLQLLLQVSAPNTGPVTMIINTLTPIQLVDETLQPLVPGALAAQGIYAVVFNGSVFQIIGGAPAKKNTPVLFEANITGSLTATVNMKYYLTSNRVIVWPEQDITWNSNTGLTINWAGLVNEIIPSGAMNIPTSIWVPAQNEFGSQFTTFMNTDGTAVTSFVGGGPPNSVVGFPKRSIIWRYPLS